MNDEQPDHPVTVHDRVIRVLPNKVGDWFFHEVAPGVPQPDGSVEEEITFSSESYQGDNSKEVAIKEAAKAAKPGEAIQVYDIETDEYIQRDDLIDTYDSDEQD